MRWPSPWLTGTRLVVGISVMAVAMIAGGFYVASTFRVLRPPEQAYAALDSPRSPTISPGLVTSRPVYPMQATWAWVASNDHEGSYELQLVLSGMKRAKPTAPGQEGEIVQGGSPCVKCHEETVGDGFFWPGWAGPPADHKQGLGCQTCHGVLARPEQQ